MQNKQYSASLITQMPGRNQQAGPPFMRRASGVKPKNMKKTLARLWEFFSKEKKSLAVIFLLTILSASANLIAPALIGRGVDAVENIWHGALDMHPLILAATLLLISYITTGLCTLLSGVGIAKISQRTVKLLRSSLFDKMQFLPLSFYDTHAHGDLMSRVTNDIDNVSSTISNSTEQLMSTSISLVGSLIIMLTISPIMTVALLIPASIAIVFTQTITRKSRPLYRKQQAALGDLMGQLEESVSALPDIHAFSREELQVEQFEQNNLNYTKYSLKAMTWIGIMMPMMNVLNNFTIALISGVGANLAINGLISIGTIASFVSYSRQFIRPLNDVADIFNTLQTAVAGAERVFEVFDEQAELADEPDAVCIAPEDVRGEVVFDNVSFGYSPDKKIIDGVSFSVPAGASVALVGETGAGKTTLVNLLARFYEVGSGKITVDGIDVSDIQRSCLRTLFGIVLQDTYLFAGTVAANIGYGNPEASFDEIVSAAKSSDADAFIRRLPNGYDTELSESGGNLSSGQRQQLSISRAMLRSSPILVLDEATSNVDTRTEVRLQRAMLSMMDGRTTFIIAHRLSTIRHADMIVVLSQGRIVEQGTHDQLIEKKGEYYSMWNAQGA
jgi:ATP-binding cassette subfamily B protein